MEQIKGGASACCSCFAFAVHCCILLLLLELELESPPRNLTKETQLEPTRCRPLILIFKVHLFFFLIYFGSSVLLKSNY